MSITAETPLATVMQQAPSWWRCRREYEQLLASRAAMQKWADIAVKGLADARPLRAARNDMVVAVRWSALIVAGVCAWHAGTMKMNVWVMGIVACAYVVGLTHGKEDRYENDT